MPEDNGGSPQPVASPCPTCGGQGCDENCGTCEHANAGPDSHRVCRTCGGEGQSFVRGGEIQYVSRFRPRCDDCDADLDLYRSPEQAALVLKLHRSNFHG